MVEGKIRVLRPMAVRIVDLGGAAGPVPLVGEQRGAEPRPLDPLQVPSGDDQVGVDVGPIQDGEAATEGYKRLHA